ncbi:MAG TPA: 30S ribosomal protein S12 methylthiotransferase RimO [Dermatophilaceae bacterium]|nr:30S ribosomal protein S12 methylthiotransferase RimO [Dermatophilaceae bacterium]
MTAPASSRAVALVTLGCTRNEVDSEELAGRLAGDGWRLVEDPASADVAVVNTCGFVEQAKKDSIDVVLQAADLKGTGRTRAVVAVGCLAERYGRTLAEELPEADAVLGFDSYADLSAHLRAVLAGSPPRSHVPRDRRRLLPLAPTRRPAAAADVAVPGLGSAPRVRLDGRPWAPLKIASGCDRRCSFCAIPAFRGSFVSRAPEEVLAEARWLAAEGVRELLLVSENSTSYGKDLGDLAALERLLPELAEVQGVERVRVSYLQPAEVRPGLLDTMASVEPVMPWFDLSFQHAAPGLLRRMRRFGGTEPFLELLAAVRDRAPDAGVRSNVIVGFPGESEADVEELERFLVAARLDVVGVFGYSAEEGTEAAGLDGALPAPVVAERVARLTDLVEELTAQRAAERLGQVVHVLIDQVGDGEEGDGEGVGEVVGNAEHQGPEVDGVTVLEPARPAAGSGAGPAAPGGSASRRVRREPGEVVRARVVASEGVDLRAVPV